MKRSKEGYYHNENRRVRRERPRGVKRRIVWGVFDVVMLVVSLLSAVALLLGLLARVVNPSHAPMLAFAGLFYPIVYLVNLFCALWWVVRWSKWVWLSAAMLLVGAGSMGLFYRSDVKTKPVAVDRGRNDVVVATYNVMNFSDASSQSGAESFDSVAEWVNDKGVQIFCIQEAHFATEEAFDSFRRSLKRLSYGYFVNGYTGEDDKGTTGSGYALFSAWPIVSRGITSSDSLAVYSVWADVKIGRDVVRVFNNHLESTGISLEERSTTLHPAIALDTLAGEKLLNIAGRVAGNYAQRAEQAEQVAEAIKQSPHPVVVCGDFNDTPMSYVYRTIRRGGNLVDAFVEKGRGVEYTFKGLYNLFRIDYIMADKEAFVVKSYDSYDEPMSDHKPLVSRLGRNEE